MKLIVEKRSVYGRDLYYPVCENAKTIAEIAGTKTLDLLVLSLCKRLGFVLELSQEQSII